MTYLILINDTRGSRGVDSGEQFTFDDRSTAVAEFVALVNGALTGTGLTGKTILLRQKDGQWSSTIAKAQV